MASMRTSDRGGSNGFELGVFDGGDQIVAKGDRGDLCWEWR